MIEFVDSLITKYNLVKDSYYQESPYSEEARRLTRDRPDDLEARIRTAKLQEKYKANIPPKWYGFNGLGAPTPLVWFDALDEFFEKLISIHPNVEIYQVKVKFGSIRIYISNTDAQVVEAVRKLADVLDDRKLIY